MVDKIALYFVPTVLTIGISTFFGWYLATGNFTTSLITMVSVFVIACPCALGLATPTALVTGLGKAATKRIFIKNIAALEIIKQV